MLLTSLYLQHFRNYENKKIDFSAHLTVIVGQNTAGKTNISEAIQLVLTGKSFRSGGDSDMVAFDQDIARVQGLLIEGEDKQKIEVVLALSHVTGTRFSKKFFINGVVRSREKATGFLPFVLFRPEELDIIIDGPSLRRLFLDEVLESIDREYQRAKGIYERSLRQRNALLRLAKETGRRNVEQFVYWDNLLITNGQIITDKRQEFLEFINITPKEIFELQTMYDKSTISRERLAQYEEGEVGAGVTLVGPHRDDFFVTMEIGGRQRDIRHFGSRGQQRLAVLQLKMLQIQFVEKKTNKKPLLVLDDIFSELDEKHIQLVLEKVQGCQIVLTTVHREFIPQEMLEVATMVELEKDIV